MPAPIPPAAALLRLRSKRSALAQDASEHPSLWSIILSKCRWAMPFLGVVLPILLLSVYTYRLASGAVATLVERNNFAEAGSVSELVTQDVRRTVSLAHAIASLPGTLDAIRTKDLSGMRNRLKGIVFSYAQVQRVVAIDGKGEIWNEYPIAIGAFGTNVSQLDWYAESLRTGKPVISAVYISSLASHHPVIGIAVPVTGAGEQRIGTLVFEYDLDQVTKWLYNSKLSSKGFVYIVDDRGVLAAHPHVTLDDALHTEYASLPQVKAALGGSIIRSEYADPVTHDRMYAAFLPFSLGHHQWVVVAQQATDEAFEMLNRVRISISLAGAALTLLTCSLIVVVARVSARNERLNRELRQKNQQLRDVASIVDSSNDAILAERLDGTVVSWNEAAERMYGYRAGEMIGQPIERTIPDDRKAEAARITKRIGGGKAVKHLETVRLRKDGTAFPVSLTLSPIRDERGAIIGISAVGRDITERKQIDQMRSDFISIVSHQLKAPIAAIRWTLELLLDGTYGKVSSAVKEALAQIADINDKNHRLVSDILNVSRIDRGVIAVALQPEKLSEIVNLAVRAYRPAFQEKKLALHIEKPRSEILVQADKEKLAEAIGNSVSNALKHTPHGSITIRSSIVGAKAVIEVIDTGDGMNEDTLKQLFRRDGILGVSVSPDRSTGLGLYITRHFMQLQHGDVTASSEIGKGSTFTYTVPLSGKKKKKA